MKSRSRRSIRRHRCSLLVDLCHQLHNAILYESFSGRGPIVSWTLSTLPYRPRLTSYVLCRFARHYDISVSFFVIKRKKFYANFPDLWRWESWEVSVDRTRFYARREWKAEKRQLGGSGLGIDVARVNISKQYLTAVAEHPSFKARFAHGGHVRTVVVGRM